MDGLVDLYQKYMRRHYDLITGYEQVLPNARSPNFFAGIDRFQKFYVYQLYTKDDPRLRHKSMGNR